MACHDDGFLPLYPQSPLRFMSGTTPMQSVTWWLKSLRWFSRSLIHKLQQRKLRTTFLCWNVAKTTPFPHLSAYPFPSVSHRNKVSRSAALLRSISAIELRFPSPWFSYWFMTLQDEHNQPVICHEGSDEPRSPSSAFLPHSICSQLERSCELSGRDLTFENWFFGSCWDEALRRG